MDSKETQLGPRPVPPAAEYEACAPGALPSGQMAFVRAIQEKFLALSRAQLAGRLETPVAAQIAAVQTLSRAAFLQSGEDGGCLLTLDAEPVRGQALVAFSAGLAAYLLRVLLGAPPSRPEGPRAVTEIELHILREIFELLARELTAAWEASRHRLSLDVHRPREATPSARTPCWCSNAAWIWTTSQESFRIAVPAFLARVAALQSASAARRRGSRAGAGNDFRRPAPRQRECGGGAGRLDAAHGRPAGDGAGTRPDAGSAGRLPGRMPHQRQAQIPRRMGAARNRQALLLL